MASEDRIDHEDQGADGELVDENASTINETTDGDDDFDLVLSDAPSMTLAELKRALDDPDDPRHEEAQELNAKMAANLAPAMEKMRAAIDKTMQPLLDSATKAAIGKTVQPLLDSVAKAASASTFRVEPVSPIRPPTLPTARTYTFNPSDGYPAKTLKALEAVGANLHEQSQILESGRTETSELSSRQLEALQSVAAGLNEQGQTLETTRAEANELNMRQLEVLESVAATLAGQGATLESMRTDAEKTALQAHTLTVRNLWIAALTLVASLAAVALAALTLLH